MLAMLIDATGNGMYLPVSLLYFHAVTGLALTRVGAIMTLAAVLGLVATPLTGVAVDRWGARPVVVGGYLLRGAGFAAYPLVANAPQMFVVTALVALGDRSFPAAIQALIAEISKDTGRDRLIAAQRSLRNAGLGAGGLIAAVALGLASRTAYDAIVLTDGATMLVAAALLVRVRARARQNAHRPAVVAASPRGGYRSVLKDRAYVLLTGVNVPVALGYSVLSVVLPVYVIQTLHAAPSWPSMLFALNTVAVAVLQVPVTRLLARLRRTRSAALGVAVFTSSFLLFAVVKALPGTSLPIAGLFVATALFTLGELMHGATASALATAAAPEPLRGRYLAFYQLSWSIPTAVAPAVFTALIAFSPAATWLLLAACTAGAACGLMGLERLLPGPAVRPWAQADPADEEHVHDTHPPAGTVSGTAPSRLPRTIPPDGLRKGEARCMR